MPSKRAVEHLNGALHLLEQAKDRPTPDMIRNIRTSVIDARELLVNPVEDPVTRRLQLIALTLQGSTEVVKKRVKGQDVEEVLIFDEAIYKSAFVMLHQLPQYSSRFRK